MARVPLLMSLLALPLLATSAAGQQLSITVVPLPAENVSPSRQDQIYAMLAQQLRRHYRARVLSGRAVGRAVWGDAGSGATQAKQQFLELVQQIERAYRTLRFDRVGQLVKQATALLEVAGPELDEAGPLQRLYLYSGLAWLAQDRKRRARAQLERLAQLAPDFELSLDEFPPDQVKAYQQVRRRVLGQTRYPLQVVSIPAGARVIIDGRFRGPTPLRLELPSGPHYLRLELDEHSAWTLVLPKGPPPDQVQARLVPSWSGDPPLDLMSKAIATERLDEAQLAVLRLLAGFFQADAVVLISLVEQGGKLLLGHRIFVVRPEQVTRARLFNLGSDPSQWNEKLAGVALTMEALSRAVPSGRTAAVSHLAPVTDRGTAPVPRPAAPPRAPADDEYGYRARGPAWYQSWWFWTIVGGVALAGAGVGLAVWLTRPEPSWTLVVQAR